MTPRPAARDVHWLAALRDPAPVVRWDLAQWQHVVRVARRLRLLGRLAEAVDASGLAAQLPEPVQRHLVAELRQSRSRLTSLEWVLECVQRSLAEAPYPRVLLKGAAYVAQGLPNARGRLPSDVDILVPRWAVEDAQQRLKQADWTEVALDAHDQRYYREWSHETPPMRHADHALELDLHHGVLPPIARTTVDPQRLLARLMPSGRPGWQVFCPVDQVLHCAAHLFQDSDLRDRMRDLVDLDSLMRHFSRHPEFWPDLLARTRQLGLDDVMALSAHFTVAWLGTPMPAAVRRQLQRRGPGELRRAGLLPLLGSALAMPDPEGREPAGRTLAAAVLLARHHWGRMPLRLLVPHLWHKARLRHRGPVEGTDGA